MKMMMIMKSVMKLKKGIKLSKGSGYISSDKIQDILLCTFSIQIYLTDSKDYIILEH